MSIDLLWQHMACKEFTWLCASSGRFEALNITVNQGCSTVVSRKYAPLSAKSCGEYFYPTHKPPPQPCMAVIKIYCTSSIRHHGYYLFRYLFCATTIRGRHLFFGKPGDINNSWISYIRVIQWRLLVTGSSTHSLSVRLSAVGTTRTIWTVLAVVIVIVRNHSHTWVRAVFTTHGYYLRAAYVYIHVAMWSACKPNYC